MEKTPFYDTDRAVSEYLLFHYGTDSEVLPWDFGPVGALNYPARCVTELLEPERLPSAARGLDLGCAVGRSTFELTRFCDEVVGIDFSQRFISVANRLQQQGSVTYGFVEEGVLMRPATAVVPEGLERWRVHFEQGDAQALRNDLGVFDVVLMANLLDRLPRPREVLQSMASRVRAGGQLLMTTPCTWLEDYTPMDEWLGGREVGGEYRRTLGTLEEVLGEDFELRKRTDIPFLIREHSRKFQWSVALGTAWLRR